MCVYICICGVFLKGRGEVALTYNDMVEGGEGDEVIELMR